MRSLQNLGVFKSQAAGEASRALCCAEDGRKISNQQDVPKVAWRKDGVHQVQSMLMKTHQFNMTNLNGQEAVDKHN